MDRKGELEKKRQRLDELRKSREGRVKSGGFTTQTVSQITKSIETFTTSESLGNSATDIDKVDNQPEHFKYNQKQISSARSSNVELRTAKVFNIDLPSMDLLAFSKNVQTEEEFLNRDWMIKNVRIDSQREEEDEMDIIIEEPYDGGFEDSIEEEASLMAGTEVKQPVEELTKERKKEIMESEGFIEFLEKSAKIVEKALDEPYHIAKDYSIDMEIPIDLEERIQMQSLFSCEKYTKDRIVTDIGYSFKHPELIVAAYGVDPSYVSHESDGHVLVWNQHMKERPEFVFQSMSSVSSVSFSRFHPNLIIGGTQLGQILLWDTRAKSLPVQHTPISSMTHTHTVPCFSLVGNPKAHHIVSLSIDGVMCAWSLDSLREPVERVELTRPNYSRIDEIAPLSMAFPSDNVANFLVGSEEGTIYHAHRFDYEQTKAGISAMDIYCGHEGPVFGLQFHYFTELPQLQDIFISCGADFTVCLWRAKMNTKKILSPEILRPIHKIDCFMNSVFDVNWSPTHPAMFATADADGILSVFNLNKDIDSPIASVSESKGRGLSRCRWHEDGSKIVTGTAAGDIQVYDVSKISYPTNDENSMLSIIINNLERTASRRLI